MFFDYEEEKQNDEQKNQIEETERKKLTCPECGKEFQDMRGLTSHARHRHNLDKKEVYLLTQKKNKKGSFWKIAGSTGAILLAILTFGRFR